MSAEEYSIKCPEHIVIGDPWYFETETGQDSFFLLYKYDGFSAALFIAELIQRVGFRGKSAENKCSVLFYDSIIIL